MSKTITAGIVTAYGAAKKAGYTGTYEDFCRDQAEFAQNAQTVAEDRAAVESATSEFINTTVPGAVSSVSSEGETQIGLVAAEGTAQKRLVTAEGVAAVEAVTAEGNTQINAVALEGATQIEAVAAEGTDQIAAVASEGETQVGLVTAEGTTQTGNVTTAGTTQVSAVQAKGAEVIASIPQAYSSLTTEVTHLKEDLTVTENDLYRTINLKPVDLAVETTIEGRLNSDGRYTADSNYATKRYSVSGYDKIYIDVSKDSDYVFQFQDSASMPSGTGTNTHVIGSTYTKAYRGYIAVPQGATKLFVTSAVSNARNVIQYTDEFSKRINDIPTTGKIPIKELSFAGVKGYINPDTGQNNVALNVNRVSFGYIKAGKGTLISCVDLTHVSGVACLMYSSSGTYVKTLGSSSNQLPITVDADAYIIVSVTTDYTDVESYISTVGGIVYLTLASTTQKEFEVLPLPVSYEFGTIDAGRPTGSATNRLRTKDYVFVGKGTKIVNRTNGINTSVVYYSAETKGYIGVTTAKWLPVLEIPYDCYIKMVHAKSITGNTTFDAPSDANIFYVPREPEGVSLPPYYFENDYISGKIEDINSHDSDCDFAGDAFAFITDTHWESNYKRSPLLMKYISDRTNIQKIVFNGDAVTADDSKDGAKADYWEFRKNFDNYKGYNWLPVIGNHEFNNAGGSSSRMSITLSESEAYGMVVKENEYIINVVDEYSYYVDNNNQKIRYAFIGCDYLSLIPTASMNALIDVMNATPNGWSLLLISHVGLNVDGTVDSRFQTLANALDTLALNENITVIGALTGHRHIDGDYTTTNGVNIIATTCDAKTEATGSSLTRTIGTISENAFDIVQIDKTNRKIYLTRIGAGDDRAFTY